MRVNALAESLASMLLAAVSTLVLVWSVLNPAFYPLRFGMTVALLIVVHALRYPRLFWCREFLLYAIFVAYMFLTLLWAPEVVLGFNTLVPALDFFVILMLFGSLATYHESRAVVVGTCSGFLTGAALYTYSIGFPFTYPEDFSYNAAAGMYLFGLLATLVAGWQMRARILPSVIAVVLLFHIAATTSIKTNLGVVLGTVVSSLMYIRYTLRALRRAALVLIVLGGAIGYTVTSNEALLDRLQDGFDRVSLGFGVLAAREDAEVRGPGLGLQTRKAWRDAGIRGWLLSPVLGNGAEAFRSDYDITSHSTPIDLLYDFGLIGCSLFYTLLGSVAWRVWRLRGWGVDGLGAVIFGALVCYGFMSLSGIVFYNAFLAAFLGMGIALLDRSASEISLPANTALTPTHRLAADSGERPAT